MGSETKILIFEDDDHMAANLQLRLEGMGYEVCGRLPNADNALEDYRKFEPDLILMDVLMEGELDGIEAAEQVHQESAVPIIFLTAHMDNQKLERAVNSGNCWYQLKPPDFNLLQATLKLALGQGKSHQEDREQLESLAAANVRMALMSVLILEMKDIENVLFETFDFHHFYTSVLENLMMLTDSIYGATALFDEQGKITDFITLGMSKEIIEKIGDYPAGKGVLGAFYKQRKMVSIEDISKQESSVGFPPGHPPMKTLLGAPIMHNGDFHGVIYLAEKKDGKLYDNNDEQVLTMFLSQIDSTLGRFYLMEKLQEQQNALEKEKVEHLEVIEELQQAQDQLLQSEKMASIGQLAAGVAHEINNPVGYINSNIATLKQYLADVFELVSAYEAVEDIISDPEKQQALVKLKEKLEIDFLKQDLQDLMQESEEGVRRVKQIVQDLKDFSHVDETDWQWADLHSGMDSTLNIAHNETKYKAEIIKEYGELPQVECIISQLNQVFMNLLVNAAHAIEDHGTITIRTGTEGEGVLIEISDTGKGMDEATLKKIFDPFFTTKPVGKGTGLGLSLSYGIIQKHGGNISVESKVGKGTTFIIWLPVKQEEQMAAS